MHNADHCRKAIRLACEKDLGSVMGIYDAARRFMRSTGNLTQWTGGYPSLAHAERDLKNGWLWVYDVGLGPVACMSVMPSPEKDSSCASRRRIAFSPLEGNASPPLPRVR